MFHAKMELPIGDVASAQYVLTTFLDLGGAPSMNMADGLRAHYGPPPCKQGMFYVHPWSIPTFSHASTPLAISGLRHPCRKEVPSRLKRSRASLRP
jgi:hypothetical protein